MGEENLCPYCQKVLGPDDPPGLCGRCLLAQGLPGVNTGPGPAGELIPELRFLDPLYGEATEESPGRYTDRREHARGGMGRILLAHDEHLNRNVVIKELLGAGDVPTDPSHSPLDPSTPLTARFLREARITAGLEHPSIVPVHELGYRDDGTMYYTMKRVEGVSLSEAIREAKGLSGRLKLLPHYLDLCQAIAFAHSRGVIHRDIKPGNVMVSEFGETVVLDWGLAKPLGKEDVGADPAAVESAGSTEDTAQGQVLGTPVYMAPEQARGATEEVDERTDVYALGAVLYTLLTGQTPFPRGQRAEVIRQVLEEYPTRIRDLEPDAPGELVAIAQKAMAKESEDRYATARELANEVQQYLTGGLVGAYAYRPAEHLARFVRQHRTGVVAAMACVVLLVAYAASAYVRVVQERDMAIEERERVERAEYARTIPLAALRIERGEIGLAEGLLADCPERLRGWEWGHLYGQCHPEELSVRAHAGYFTAFAASADRALLATAGEDGTVAVWDGVTLAERWRIDGPWALRSIAFAPDGKKLAAQTTAGGLVVFDAGEGLVVSGPEASAEGTQRRVPKPGQAATLLFAPDGQRVYGLADNVVTVWNTDNWAVENRFDDLRVAQRTGLAVSQGGSVLVVAGSGGRYFQVEGLDPSTGASLWFHQDITVLDDTAGVIATPYDGGSRVLCHYGYSFGVLSLENSEPKTLSECELPTDLIAPVTCQAMGPAGDSFVVGNHEGGLLVFSPDEAAFVGSVGTSAPVQYVTFTRDGTCIVAADEEGWLKRIDRHAVERPPNRVTFNEQQLGMTCTNVAFSPDGRYLAASNWRVPELLSVWDMDTGVRRRLPTPEGAEEYMDFVPITGELMVPVPGELRFYDVEDWRPTRSVPVEGMVHGGEFDAEGRYLIVKTGGRGPRVLDMAAGEDLGILAEVPMVVSENPDDMSVAIAPDGGMCAATSSCSDRTWVLRLPSGDIVHELPCSDAYVSGPRGLAFHPDGELLALGYSDGLVTVCDLDTGESVSSFEDAGGEVYCVAFSPDGRRLAVTTQGQYTRVWDWEQGVELVGAKSDSYHALDVAFSPDGSMLAFADANQATTQLLLGADGGARQGRWRAWAEDRAACREGLLRLDDAFLDWTARNGVAVGTPVTNPAELLAELDAHEHFPECPMGGEYRLGVVGELPVCSVHRSLCHDLSVAAESLERAHQRGSAFAITVCEQRVTDTLVDNPGYLNGMAWQWAQEEDRFYEAAVMAAERAVSMEPQNSGLLDTLAWAEYKASHLDEAVGHFRQAIDNGCDSRPGLARALVTRAAEGDLAEACAVLERYIPSEPVDEEVTVAVEMLQQALPPSDPLQPRVDRLVEMVAGQ